jgi:hypothetical protein
LFLARSFDDLVPFKAWLELNIRAEDTTDRPKYTAQFLGREAAGRGNLEDALICLEPMKGSRLLRGGNNHIQKLQ